MFPIIIGIGGVTAGGKTTLCEKLTEHFGESNVFSLHMDDYYHEYGSGKLEYLEEYVERSFPHWDSVRSVDFEKLVSNLDALLNELNTQEITETSSHSGTPIVLVDGILIYEYPPLQKYFNLRYFITLSKDQALERRVARSKDDPEYYEPESYFENYVWPSYLDVLQKLKDESENRNHPSGADFDQYAEQVVFLDGNDDKSRICVQIAQDITQFAGHRRI